MTRNDRRLIRQASKIKYWEYKKVYGLISKADSKECEKKLKNIAALLYDYYCNEI